MSTAVAMRTTVAARKPCDVFLEQLCRAQDRVLLLDYDGTIAPFSAQRNRAYPYPTIPELLDCIMSTCRTSVVLISGRAAREIPPLLGLNPHPEIWGSYGIERLSPEGTYFVDEVSEDAQRALAEADAALRKAGMGHLVEVKPGAIAVHWRGLNPTQTEQAKAAAYRMLSPHTLQTLLLAEFDGGLELRERVRSKADVVRLVISENSPDVPVAYLGDDNTDEEAFRALNGRGLTVLVRPTYRFTAAQTWFRPPGELVQFFADWIRACGGEL